MTHVIDSSVVLAYLLNERGGERLLESGRCYHLSLINLAEIYTKVLESGGAIEDVDAVIAALPIRVRAFREAHAVDIGRLRLTTRHRGLSFGDRACLALALGIKLPVLTADTRWSDLDLDIEIIQIR